MDANGHLHLRTNYVADLIWSMDEQFSDSPAEKNNFTLEKIFKCHTSQQKSFYWKQWGIYKLERSLMDLYVAGALCLYTVL